MNVLTVVCVQPTTGRCRPNTASSSKASNPQPEYSAYFPKMELSYSQNKMCHKYLYVGINPLKPIPTL